MKEKTKGREAIHEGKMSSEPREGTYRLRKGLQVPQR
jgi:hypothetical protein